QQPQEEHCMLKKMIGLVAGLGLVAATGAASAQDKVLIGHYGSLTGSEATFGQSTSNGIKLAIKEINAAGGVNGKMLELREYDTRGDAGEAKLAVERLVKSDKVAVVLGEVASKLSLAGGPVCQEAGVPMITPSSTNPQVTAGKDMVFRVCFIDPFQGYAGAKFARENLKAKTAALLVDQAQAYAVGLAEEFDKNFAKMGGTVATRQTYAGGAQDFTAQLTSIRSAKPDVIYIPGYYTDVGNIALQARKLGITAPLLGGDGWDSDQLAKIGKDAIEGCYYTNHYAPDQPEARVQDFIKAYKKEFNGATPDGLAALGYDAAKIFADSMKRAKSTEGKALRDAIAATKNFPGVTGDITINAQRDAKKSAVVVEMAGDPPAPKYVTTVKPE
ncbi:MAG TPA: ABC transporter substrate-binding protein, partial [Phycisphaerales bacterium]|nr:ABC transporter substrate-binding protein [Phycisphaerales bacterium]